MKNCKNCYFWRPSSPTATSAACRVDGPTAQIDSNVNQPKGTWPFTDAEEDCGKFERGDMGVFDSPHNEFDVRLAQLEKWSSTMDASETATLSRLAALESAWGQATGRIAKIEQAQGVTVLRAAS